MECLYRPVFEADCLCIQTNLLVVAYFILMMILMTTVELAWQYTECVLFKLPGIIAK